MYECNDNIVNHGISNFLSLTQSQFDLLKDAFIIDPDLLKLTISMIPIKEREKERNSFIGKIFG